MGKKKERTYAEEMIFRLTTEFRPGIWSKFIKAIRQYDLLKEGDHVAICISGGKDSFLMAVLFKNLLRHSDFPFKVTFIVMDPGYSEPNAALIRENLRRLEIPARIVKTDIFEIANATDRSPCYLCAKMRRGALYRIAKDAGCNKIALGHHYDDVIETTLMNMLNSGSFQTMLPKLPSTNYAGMELIRPLYLVRESEIKAFVEASGLHFLQCACRFTEEVKGGEMNSQRAKTKQLITELKQNYNPLVEKNIFVAASNVQLDKIVGYAVGEESHDFLENYEEKKNQQFVQIEKDNIEVAAIEKAIREHRGFEIDDSLEKEFA